MDDRITSSHPAAGDVQAPRCKDGARSSGGCSVGCSVCGQPLRANDIPDGNDIVVCDRRECRRSLLGKQPASAQRRITNALRERVARIANERSEGLPGAVALLPANTRSLTPVTSAIRARFVETIRARLTRPLVPGDDDRAAEDPDVADAPTDAADALLRLGCAVCAGHCCTRGGSHAFLSPADLHRVARSIGLDVPEKGGADADAQAALEARYTAHMPATHFEGSCVFHGEHGCTLPRTMRSRTCNRYLCGGLSTLSRAVRETNSHTVVVGASTWARLERVAALDASVNPASMRSVPTSG